MEGIIPPENNSPTLSLSALKLFILTHQRYRVYDGASYRTVLLQSRLSVFLVFCVVFFFFFSCCLQRTANTIQPAINKSQGFIRLEQKQFRHLLLMDSFGAEDERLTFTFIRPPDLKKIKISDTHWTTICFINAHLDFLQRH